VTGSRAARLRGLAGGAARWVLSLYPPWKWCVLAVVAALGVLCYYGASATVSVADPPQLAQLGVGLRLTQPSAHLVLPYNNDATVELVHGCRNPVAVAMHVHPTESAVRLPPISVGLAVADGAARKVAAVTVSDKPVAVRRTSASDSPSRRGWVARGRVAQYDKGFFIRFQADWLTRRGFRSCYVVLPDLTGEYAERSQELLSPNQTDDFQALKGTVHMRPGGHGGLEPFASTPPPDDLRGQTWTCSRNPKLFKFGTRCSAVGVFDESNANGAASARIFVFGALLGVFLGTFIDLARPRRLRSSENAH
jgi:hypothetical protein